MRRCGPAGTHTPIHPGTHRGLLSSEATRVLPRCNPHRPTRWPSSPRPSRRCSASRRCSLTATACLRCRPTCCAAAARCRRSACTAAPSRRRRCRQGGGQRGLGAADRLGRRAVGGPRLRRGLSPAQRSSRCGSWPGVSHRRRQAGRISTSGGKPSIQRCDTAAIVCRARVASRCMHAITAQAKSPCTELTAFDCACGCATSRSGPAGHCGRRAAGQHVRRRGRGPEAIASAATSKPRALKRFGMGCCVAAVWRCVARWRRLVGRNVHQTCMPRSPIALQAVCRSALHPY
jgi:hypothetical protein